MIVVASVPRFGLLHRSSGIHSYACSLVHTERSWWGLESSLHLHVDTYMIAVTTALGHINIFI
jgi:hypothetical protein